MCERDKHDEMFQGRHFGPFEGVADLLISPSWEGLKALAREGHRRKIAKRRKLRAARKRRERAEGR
jgi:hypothetical protein